MSTSSKLPDNFTCRGELFPCVSESGFDPEVAGIGIMVSYFATAASTIAIILFAYFQDCLPDDTLENYVDHRLKASLARILYRKKAKTPSEDTNHSTAEKKERKRRGYRDFVLVSSDQQLVTGLAILVAGFMICNISLYSFTVVSTVGWFSSTTHLSSLAVVKSYHTKHPNVRILRVILMLFVALLLLASQLIVGSIWLTPDLDPHDCLYCVLRLNSYSPDLFSVFISMWVIGAYTNRITGLFSTQGHQFKGGLFTVVMKKIDTGWEDKTYQQVLLDSLLNLKRSRKLKRVTVLATLFQIAYLDLKDSFCWEIVWLLAHAGYGLASIIGSWLGLTISHQMTFGQLVPLLLLILPVFALVEAFDDREPSHPAPQHPQGTQVGGNDATADTGHIQTALATSDDANSGRQEDSGPEPNARQAQIHVPDPTVTENVSNIAQQEENSTPQESTPAKKNLFLIKLRMLDDFEELYNSNDGKVEEIPIYRKILKGFGLYYSAYVLTAGTLLRVSSLSTATAGLVFIFALFIPEIFYRHSQLAYIWDSRVDRARRREPAPSRNTILTEV